MDFAKNLRMIRQARGLTQKELGDQLLVTKTTIYNWERGSREPRLSLLEDIADVLKVSVKDLLGLK